MVLKPPGPVCGSANAENSNRISRSLLSCIGNRGTMRELLCHQKGVHLFSMVSRLTAVNFLLISKCGCQKDLKAAVFLWFGEEVTDLFLEPESTVSL